jgi:hypothetical protein
MVCSNLTKRKDLGTGTISLNRLTYIRPRLHGTGIGSPMLWLPACARARHCIIVLFPKVGKCNQTNDTYTFKQSKILQTRNNYAQIITGKKSMILLLYTNNILTYKTNL